MNKRQNIINCASDGKAQDVILISGCCCFKQVLRRITCERKR
jgi:hypothetical protein